MRWLGARAFAVVLATVASTLAVGPSPAAAQVPLLTITDVAGVTLNVSGNGGTQYVQAPCPAGQVPLSGYVTSSAPDDVRRLFEWYDAHAGGIFNVGVVNFGAGTLQVTAHVRCVPFDHFGSIITVSGTFDALSDHVAEGTVTCPDGWIAINATVTEPSSPERTLLTTTPTADLTGWTARGWVGNPDDPDEVLTIDAHCVPASTLPGIRVVPHLDDYGWNVPATAECPTGLVPAFGGTHHVGGDRGAITVHQRPTATGWASTTLSLDGGGSMLTTVACVPDAYPTISLGGSSGYSNVPELSWTFAADDPEAGGGYSITYLCTFLHAGVGSLERPCTSPVNRSGLKDGVHRIRVHAETSDGRESPPAEATLVVDTVAPTVTVTKPPIFPLGTSASPTWSGQDATSGIAGYELRRRRTPLVGDPGPWTTVSLPASATSRTFTSLLQGSTYCYGVRATDLATNVGPWVQRCAAIPLDDRAMTRSGGWTESTTTGWFGGGTALETTTQNARLSKNATVRRIALTVLTCPTCGTVGVYVAGAQVGTIDLASATTARRLIALPAFALTTGTVMVKVLSSGELVRIDAVSMSRH